MKGSRNETAPDSPYTNPHTDPFTGYWEDGCAGYFWAEATRGYAWLFRPDYDFFEGENVSGLTRTRALQ